MICTASVSKCSELLHDALCTKMDAWPSNKVNSVIHNRPRTVPNEAKTPSLVADSEQKSSFQHTTKHHANHLTCYERFDTPHLMKHQGAVPVEQAHSRLV